MHNHLVCMEKSKWNNMKLEESHVVSSTHHLSHVHPFFILVLLRNTICHVDNSHMEPCHTLL